MSRSGYSDDWDGDANWVMIRWRGAVKSAINGKRGQAFLRELIKALDALPKPELIASELESGDQVCAIGAVGKMRGLDMSELDPEDIDYVASVFGIPRALACEIVYENDEGYFASSYSRFEAMRRWAVAHLNKDL
jgi:hypothetical protein